MGIELLVICKPLIQQWRNLTRTSHTYKESCRKKWNTNRTPDYQDTLKKNNFFISYALKNYVFGVWGSKCKPSIRSQRNLTRTSHTSKKSCRKKRNEIRLPIIKIHKKNNVFTSYALKNNIFGVLGVKMKAVDLVVAKLNQHPPHI